MSNELSLGTNFMSSNDCLCFGYSGLLQGKNCLSAELHVFHVGRRDAKEASTCASDWVMIIKLLWLQHNLVAMTTAAPSTHLHVCNTSACVQHT